MKRCPECGHANSGVTDSRDHNGSIRRRRKCKKCGAKWSTIEVHVMDLHGGIDLKALKKAQAALQAALAGAKGDEEHADPSNDEAMEIRPQA